jgi:hypothetical protein
MSYTNGLDKPSDYFNIVLRQGFGSSGGTVTGLSFKPEMIWEKNRTSTIGTGTYVYDIVRGAQKYIRTNLTNAEATAQTLISFNSDGFTTGSSDYPTDQSLVAWSWSAGNTSGSSNTDGDITSTVSANTISGFSIVKWTGNGTASGTVGHGLGVAPKIVLYKKLNGTSDWFFWTTQIDGSNDDLRLNTTGTKSDLSGTSGSITSSTFSNYGWGVSDNMIAYCFAEKKSFSKFGSYVGNGNASDGTFVYTGFSPAWVMVKRTDSTNNWVMRDNKRKTFNTNSTYIFADTSAAEGSGGGKNMDFLSNGFKCYTTDASDNASGGTYIYMAFASEPLTGTNGVPCTAR